MAVSPSDSLWALCPDITNKFLRVSGDLQFDVRVYPISIHASHLILSWPTCVVDTLVNWTSNGESFWRKSNCNSSHIIIYVATVMERKLSGNSKCSAAVLNRLR